MDEKTIALLLELIKDNWLVICIGYVCSAISFIVVMLFIRYKMKSKSKSKSNPTLPAVEGPFT